MRFYLKKVGLSFFIIGLLNLPAFASLSDYDVFIGSEYWAMNYTYTQGSLSYNPLIMAIEMRKNFTDKNMNAGFRIYSGKDQDFHTDFIQIDLLYPFIDNQKDYFAGGVAWLGYHDRDASSAISQYFQSLGIEIASRTYFSPVFNAYAKLFHSLYNWSDSELGPSSALGYDLGFGLYFEDAGEALYTLGYRSNAYNARDNGGSEANKAASGFYIQANILIQ